MGSWKMIRCLNCGKKNDKKEGVGLNYFCCSSKCCWAWRDHIHFIDTDWKVPNLSNQYFIDLDINKRQG